MALKIPITNRKNEYVTCIAYVTEQIWSRLWSHYIIPLQLELKYLRNIMINNVNI